MKYKSNESGRSMVEMLGVLAIIGVLSVTGIAGYVTAMRSHTANGIVNATSLCYMMGMAQNTGTGGTPMLMLPNPDGVTSITFKKTNQVEIAGIADAKLCEQVKNRFGDKATDCPAASPYTLTITLGEVKEATNTGPEINEGDDCNGSGVYDSDICLNGKSWYCYDGMPGYDKWTETGPCSTCDSSSTVRIKGIDYCCYNGVWAVCGEHQGGGQIVEGEHCVDYACTSNGRKIGCYLNATVDCENGTYKDEGASCYFNCVDDGNGGYQVEYW